MIPAEVQLALERCLTSIVHYKNDLYCILKDCGVSQAYIGSCRAANLSKRDTVQRLFNQLEIMGPDGLGILRRLLRCASDWTDFSSSEVNETAARDAVATLKQITQNYDLRTEEERQKTEAERLKREAAYTERTTPIRKLEELNKQFLELFREADTQKTRLRTREPSQ